LSNCLYPHIGKNKSFNHLTEKCVANILLQLIGADHPLIEVFQKHGFDFLHANSCESIRFQILES
jgi:hypothetical protein